jgi:hypothetical protein
MTKWPADIFKHVYDAPFLRQAMTHMAFFLASFNYLAHFLIGLFLGEELVVPFDLNTANFFYRLGFRIMPVASIYR